MSDLTVAPQPAWDVAGDDGIHPLAHSLWVLRRHCGKMLAFVGTVGICAWVLSARLTPLYESTAIVDVDRRVPTAIVGQESTQAALNDGEQFFATQMHLIQSDAVLRPVADQFRLEGSRQGIAREAPVCLKDLRVTRPANTYLLQIGYRAADRQMAAEVANGIAKSYVENTYQIRFRSSASISTFMERQLEELKTKMERSDEALARFERELNVVDPQEKTNILSARLLQLNTDYTAAQTERVRKEAAYQSVHSGTLEAAQASDQGDALKGVMDRFGLAQAKFAEVKSHYGPNHPEYRKSEAQVSQALSQVDGARVGVIRRVEAGFREAAHREEMLRDAVRESKAEFDRIKTRSYEYESLKHEAETDRKLYQELITKIREAGINAGFQSNTVRIADIARPSLSPVYPNIPRNVTLAVLIAGLLAVGVALVGDTLDQTIRNSSQVEHIARTAVIGGLPRVKSWKRRGGRKGAVSRWNGGGDIALTAFGEAVRTLRNSILLANADRPIQSLMVTSATPGEGKSTVCLHLAMAHAEQNRRTLLIDCDLRQPSVHAALGLEHDRGLSAVLLRATPWRECVRPAPEIPNLDVLPAGVASRRAADLVGPALPRLLEEAKEDYDLVLLDSPPALGFPEPLQMATAVDGVALIALAGQTDRRALASLVGMLQRVRVNVLGVALNEITRDGREAYPYYGYHDNY